MLTLYRMTVMHESPTVEDDVLHKVGQPKLYYFFPQLLPCSYQITYGFMYYVYWLLFFNKNFCN